MALQPIEEQGLSIDCFPHFHFSAQVKDHPAFLGIECGQHAVCWLSRPVLPLQIRNCQNS